MKPEEFIGQLQKLVDAEDRAALARLRHSLAFAPGEYVHAFPFVERFTATLSGTRRRLYFLVAGLFATHPERSTDPQENLGRSLKRLYLEQHESPSTEKRFLALLEADDEQLPEHLRHLVGLLRAKGIPVNWERLLQDLLNRQYEQDQGADTTKQRWAQSFYRPLAETPESQSTEIPSL